MASPINNHPLFSHDSKKLKILYFHQYFCTPRGSWGVRSYEFSKRWVQQGHSVSVVTGAASEYDPTLHTSGVAFIDGIEVQSLGTRYSSMMGPARRIYAFLEFAILSSWIALGSRKYDVVLVTSTPLTVAFPAITAKLLAGRPVVFEVRDVWPDAAVDIGQLQNPVLVLLARWVERLAYTVSDVVVPLSVGMSERIQPRLGKHTRKEVIPNCCDIEFFSSNRRHECRTEMKSRDRFVILYLGSLGASNDVDCLAACIDLLHEQNGWEWWFVGDGNRATWLKEQAIVRKWSRVKFLSRQPHDKIPYFISGADCGVISFSKKPVFFENSPNKFFDYIAGSLPVVFNRTTWLAPYLTNYDCGYEGSDGCPKVLASNIIRLIRNPGKLSAMKKNSKRLASERFDRDVLAMKYLEILKSVSTKG